MQLQEIMEEPTDYSSIATSYYEEVADHSILDVHPEKVTVFSLKYKTGSVSTVVMNYLNDDRASNWAVHSWLLSLAYRIRWLKWTIFFLLLEVFWMR